MMIEHIKPNRSIPSAPYKTKNAHPKLSLETITSAQMVPKIEAATKRKKIFPLNVVE